jgi:hypothetical protein
MKGWCPRSRATPWAPPAVAQRVGPSPIGEFASVDDHKAYSANPDHQKLVADVIRPHIKNVTRRRSS